MSQKKSKKKCGMKSVDRGYVEFVGMPSSGKTSVVSGLLGVLPEAKYSFPIQQVQSAPWLRRSLQRVVGAGAGMYNQRVRNLFKSLSPTYPATISELKAWINFLWLARSVQQSASTRRTPILTEGVFQAWWGLRVRGIVNDSSLSKVIDFADFNGCSIIWLFCDAKYIKQRISNRVHSSYSDNNKSDGEVLKESMQVIKFILERVERQGINVTRIDTGEQSLSASIQKAAISLDD